ncbi:SixA phosphatase family protein [Patiriisocius sp. Uisw_047]|uniref:SixA phosphatase family protein n=1 Tax=Patiriisocius sp. Uisw_047 TaxID=3230969 RepID=UPI0039E91BDF
MKTLYMSRHAKSSWKQDVTDHQRPLKGRGEKDGVLVSAYVADNFPAPELIISSEAVRALSTATYYKDAWSMEAQNFKTNNDLYDFSGQQVMRVIKDLNNSNNCVMIVGHNHAFTAIANMLGSEYMDNMPTCGFVAIEFNVEAWQDVTKGKTIHRVFPRDLK